MSARHVLFMGLVLFASSSLAGTLRIEWPENAVRKGRDSELTSLWAQWEVTWGELGRVNLKVRALTDRFDLAAHTDGESISLHPLTSAEEVSSLLRHELAHAYTSRLCPALQQDPFASEALALWMSGDDARLIREANETGMQFLSESEKLFREGGRLDRVGLVRLARLSLEHRGKNAELLSRDEMRRFCEMEPVERRTFLAAKWLSFTPCESGKAGASIADGKMSFLFQDLVSGEVVRDEGPNSTAAEVASLLKPLLLWDTEKPQPQKIGTGPEWGCGDLGDLKIMDWRAALAHSCNGYFLGARLGGKNLISEKFLARLQAAGLLPSDGALSIAEATGLTPGLRASPHQLLRLYRRALGSGQNAARSEILGALQKTAVSGTLAGLPESAWFVSRGIALKSGTSRGLRSQPNGGWLLAIDGADEGPRWIALLHADGRAPRTLMAELKSRLLPLLPAEAFEPLEIGVLSLLRHRGFTVDCPNDTAIPEKASTDFKAQEAFTCGQGPLRIRFRKDPSAPEQSRELWGQLRRIDYEFDESTLGGKARAKRARAGSDFVLRTSRQYYVSSVLAAEYPTGRLEVQKALAQVIRSNSHEGRHGMNGKDVTRRLCDTTHCQVFGIGREQVSTADWRRLKEITFAAFAMEPRWTPSWKEFSLGGEDEWRESRDRDEIHRALDVSELISGLIRTGDRVTLQLGQSGRGRRLGFTCEAFRSLLSLRSCPTSVREGLGGRTEFVGRGEGHGRGLSLKEAEVLALQGETAESILRHFYPASFNLIR